MKAISTIKTFQMAEIMKSKLRSLLTPSFTRKRIISPLIKTISNISHPFSPSRRKGINMSLSLFKLQHSHFPSYSYNHITIWFLSSHVSADSKFKLLLVWGISSTRWVKEPFSHNICKFFYIKNNRRYSRDPLLNKWFCRTVQKLRSKPREWN